MACVLRRVVPSMKLTVPSGVTPPPPEMVTVAVKVTFWPTAEGFAVEVKLVEVPSRTVWTSAGAEVLVKCMVSPL